MQQEPMNVTVFDRGLRQALGLALILSVLTQPWAPPWLALLATYPIFTAILAWDPLYAMIAKLTAPVMAPRLVNRPAV